MTTKEQSLVPALDALANWRQSLARELSSITLFFTSNDLLSAVRQVLRRAIEAGGSTLKDFSANGAAGHYQEQAQVYGREGEPCNTCGTAVRRIVQGQRSTFFCGVCQKR